jgi:hypothetical protein
VHRLTKEQARRIAVRARPLDAPRPTDLLVVVQRLTLLQDQEAPARLSVRSRAERGTRAALGAASEPSRARFPSPRSDSVWSSDNFRADAFAKAVRRAAAKVEPARRADFERPEFHAVAS